MVHPAARQCPCTSTQVHEHRSTAQACCACCCVLVSLFAAVVCHSSQVVGVESAQAGDAVEGTETRSLTAAVDQAMVAEPQEQELAGSPRDMDYDANQVGLEGSSPVSDENNTDFAAVRSVLSAIDARESTSD